MNYTENYHLPQWVETDRILMKDFNDAMASIEEGLTQGNQGAAESAAKAQATADQALADAAKAQAKADAAYAPDKPPYVCGTYTGTGQDLTITTGFQPSFLVISGYVSPNPDFGRAALVTRGMLPGHVTFTNTGFTVHPVRWSGGSFSSPLYPDLSDSGITYSYIAFR